MTSPDFKTDAEYSKLKKQIILHEGKRHRVYTDSTGNPTIGVGFNLNRPDATRLLRFVGGDYRALVNGKDGLTDEQIDVLLNHTIMEATSTARALFRNFDHLDPVRRRVVIDMAFNMGRGTLGTFEKDKDEKLPDNAPAVLMGTIDLIEASRYEEAANRMEKSLWYKQTKTRAKRLVQMMRTGEDYGE